MPDSVNLDWGLLNENQPNYNQNVNQTALSSLQLQQARGGYNALQGIDTSDPNAIQNAVGNSIKSGDLPQASALLGFGRQQMLYNLADQAIKAKTAQLQPNALQGVPQTPMTPQQNSDVQSTLGGSSEATPSPTPETVNIGGQDYDKQKYLDHADKIDFEVDNAKSKTGDERTAYVQKIAPDLGITTEQVANADLSDEGLDKIKNTLQAHRDVVNGNVQQVSPSDIIDPDFVQQMALTSGDPAKITEAFKATHPNLQESGLPGVLYDPVKRQTIRLVSGNDISAQAAQTAGATAAAQVGPHIAEKVGGIEAENENVKKPFYAPGSTQPVQMTQAEADAIAKASGGKVNFSTEPEKGATAAAEARGQYSGGVHDITYTDPTTNQTRTVTLPGDKILSNLPSVAGLGVGASVADQVRNSGEATALKDEATAVAKNDYQQKLKEQEITGLQLVSLADEVGTGRYTKGLSDIAQRLAPLLPAGSNIKDYASNADQLAGALKKAVMGNFSGTALPRVSSEWKFATGTVPDEMSTPDRIKFYGAMLQAQAHERQANAKYVMQREAEGAPGLSQVSLDWMNKENKQPSYFADPAFLNLKIGGKPASVINPTPINGHTYGVAFPGTPHQMTFQAQ